MWASGMREAFVVLTAECTEQFEINVACQHVVHIHVKFQEFIWSILLENFRHGDALTLAGLYNVLFLNPSGIRRLAQERSNRSDKKSFIALFLRAR